jgi:hypothetical protein
MKRTKPCETCKGQGCLNRSLDSWVTDNIQCPDCDIGRVPDDGLAVIESMTKWHICGMNIRIWRNEEALKSTYDNTDVLDAIQTWMQDKWVSAQRGFTMHDLAKFISDQPRINAVEVVKKNGAGLVLYREWP